MDVRPSLPDDRSARYLAAAADEDARLTARLAEIRNREDSATISVREAAAERIAAMEQNLHALQQLRQQHLGGGQ